MSFLSRCPACATTFRVVDDQLKLANGWVRCGACQHVYDALPSLHHEPAAPDAPAVPVPVATPVPAAAPAPMPVAVAVASTAPEPDPIWVDEPLQASPAAPRVADTLAAKPAFVQQAERRAFWRRPSVRLVLAGAALLAVVALGLQAAWLWRDTLSVRWPAAQPWLVQLCQPLGCRVAAPRLPQALSIESSALLRADDNRYTFDLVVKNRQDHAVAAPALELTLLDATQRVRLRRVLLATEWPQARDALGAGAEWPVRFELALDAEVTADLAGYRALLFYP